MPPASNAASASSKSKANRFSTSPDSEPTLPEPEIPVVSSKKKKKNAASRQVQNSSYNERVSNVEIARSESPPPTRPQTILSQIPHGFPARRDSPLLEINDDDTEITGKVSDQYTPPDNGWLEDAVHSDSPPVEQAPTIRRVPSPPIEPGFSTRARYDSKSPPISPPPRYARPLSYGGGIPPIPAIPRASPTAYGYSPNAYGSPPAPHLPQPHFYHAQDINLGVPRSVMPHFKEEPFLHKYTQLPLGLGTSRQGILLGFEGRLHILRIGTGVIEEVGMLEGFSGSVVDAVVLEWNAGLGPLVHLRPLIAVVVHGPKQTHVESADTLQEDGRIRTGLQPGQQVVEYTTKVQVFSLSTQECVATLLETPGQSPQTAFRGANPTPPNPLGHLKLQASGSFLIVSSGVSGEVYAFTVRKSSPPAFECVGKFWTTIQPQAQRRDSSHHQQSDADISPADLGRATNNIDRPLSSLNGRWLAICPATSPSRPSLNAVIGSEVLCGRHTGIDTTSAPSRPPISCEVDSPDADTLFGKVARGVAQELVKGAKWLGDQGYSTWQSYWKKDQSPSLPATQPPYSPPNYAAGYVQSAFPPTHGEASRDTKEPAIIAVYDLQALHEMTIRKGVDEVKPMATFQPPRGCSYLSFAPHGLNLLTAGRKGDVQYVWDLMQIKNCRTSLVSADEDRTRLQPRVRQVAKYERLSGSTIIDVVWDAPTGARFAVLTRNKTIHLFDLPSSAFRWPPPRSPKKSRPSSRSIDSTQPDGLVTSGFFASAMNIANQAQPILANWRGRAPSMGGGLAGIGQTSIGLASATGARGGKAVAAGLSKSLGAASETVSQIRHAGESRLHLKSSKDALPGKVFWAQRGRQSIFAILDVDSIKQYQVRKNTNPDKRDRDIVTVFAARKAIVLKLPALSRLSEDAPELQGQPYPTAKALSGYWKSRSSRTPSKQALEHPLSFAEIETNVPYQPFHSDRRVTLSVYSESIQVQNDALQLTPVTRNSIPSQAKNSKGLTAPTTKKWVFGDDIPTIVLGISKLQIPDDEDDHTGSVIYRETVKVTSPTAGDDDMDQIVSTTRRRKVKKSANAVHDASSDGEKEDGFFEDDCDVLDFATDRV